MGHLYYQVVDVTDFGPYVTKLILGMPRKVTAQELKPELFSVYVEGKDKAGQVVELPKSFIQRDQFIPSRGYRPHRRPLRQFFQKVGIDKKRYGIFVK